MEVEMKTIEELGQLARDTWYEYWPGEIPKDLELDCFTMVAKAIVTALAEDGVSWAPGDDDETKLTAEEFDARAADGEPVLVVGVETARVRFGEVFDRIVKQDEEILRRPADS
jgi:hypothetical protein